MYKKLYLSGIIAYAVLLVFAILFYKERMILPDTSFFLFNIVKDNSFCIQVYRFGDMFSQVFAVLARRMELPLDIVMLCYSAGFIVWHLVCYLVCGSVLKQYRYALVILFANLLFTTGTFYWTISQLPQGISLLMVLMAYLADKQWDDLNMGRRILVAIGIITLAFFHPILVFAFGFALVFFTRHEQALPDKKVVIFIVAVYAAALVVKMTIFRTPYERHSLSGVKNFIKLFPDYFSLYSNKAFLKNCLNGYIFIPIVLISVAVLYAVRGEWKKLAFFAGCFLGYLWMVNIIYDSAETPDFYIESQYMLLALILGLPFVFGVVPRLGRRLLAPLFFMTIIAVGCVRIYDRHYFYARRLAYERVLLSKYGGKKIIADARRADKALLQMLWGTPYEFWMLSTTEGHSTASIIIDDHPGERGWAWDMNKIFLVNWNVVPYARLSPRYFHFADTTTGYMIDRP